DAFNRVADDVDAALAKERSVVSLALAMLDWSRRFSNRWTLIYGTPVADYEAPREETVVPGTRVMVALAQLVAEAGGRASEPGPVGSRRDPVRRRRRPARPSRRCARASR